MRTNFALMKIGRIVLLLFPVFFFSLSELVAQPDAQWFNMAATNKLNERHAIGADVQFRIGRSEAGTRDEAVFNTLKSARLWYYYQLPGEYTLITSPIAMFSVQENHRRILEYRVSTGVSKKIPLAAVNTDHRVLYEYSTMWFSNNSIRRRQRYRLRNQAQITLLNVKNSSIDYAISSELFFKTEARNHNFDQYRIATGLHWKTLPNDFSIHFQLNVFHPSAAVQRQQQILLTWHHNL